MTDSAKYDVSCDHYRHEAFLIYDQTHRLALIHRPKEATPERTEIVNLEELALPEAGGQELTYRRLWKRFYDTVAIRERLNPRAQMSRMPKRYWARLTEMRKE